MNLLLDSHAFIWYVEDDERLSRNIKNFRLALKTLSWLERLFNLKNLDCSFEFIHR